jgi:hypothetical protein
MVIISGTVKLDGRGGGGGVLNYATSAYIPIMTDQNQVRLVTPAQAVSSGGIHTGRPYLDRATEELLIGLIQLAFYPTEDEWFDLWEAPPPQSEIEERLARYEGRMHWREAFQIDNNSDEQPISMIMPDGASGRKTDFNAAILSRTYKSLSVPYAMLALNAFHLMCANLRAGDGGYTKGGISAASLRVRPVFDGGWQNIWASVMPDMAPLKGKFPWESLDPKPKPNSPLDLMAYFLVSRRICFGDTSVGECSITHQKGEVVSTIRTANSVDVNLDENIWVHPLCPRQRVVKKGAAAAESYHFRSVRVPNVTSWREWVGYTQSRGTAGGQGFEPSRVVDVWRRSRGPELDLGSLRLLAYGMRYEKADPIGWVETLGHIYTTAADRTDDLFAEAEHIWNSADTVRAALAQALKSIVAKPDPDQLWFDTEKNLESTLSAIATAFSEGATRTSEALDKIRNNMLKTIIRTGYRQFDLQTANAILHKPNEVREARHRLSRSLNKIGV